MIQHHLRIIKSVIYAISYIRSCYIILLYTCILLHHLITEGIISFLNERNGLSQLIREENLYDWRSIFKRIEISEINFFSELNNFLYVSSVCMFLTYQIKIMNYYVDHINELGDFEFAIAKKHTCTYFICARACRRDRWSH